MSEEEAAELDELRQRIYGPDSTAVFTETDLERLRWLEGDDAPGDSTTLPEVLPVEHTGAGLPREPVSASASPFRAHRVPWRFWLGATVAGLALAGIGYGVGAAVTTPKPPETLPEFGFAQTDEDVLPESFLAEDDTLDPDSTRFVGRIDGYVIYLAQNIQSDGVCVLALTDDAQPEAFSMGCFGPMTPGGGATSGVTDALEIGVGERSPELSRGTPIRLSESVTAYRS